MFHNGVYIFEVPHEEALDAFIFRRWYDHCCQYPRFFEITPEHKDFDLFYGSFYRLHEDQLVDFRNGLPNVFLRFHFDFARWHNKSFRSVRYCDFVKSYYDQQKDSK